MVNGSESVSAFAILFRPSSGIFRAPHLRLSYLDYRTLAFAKDDVYNCVQVHYLSMENVSKCDMDRHPIINKLTDQLPAHSRV